MNEHTTVLVVEDEPLILMDISSYLSGQGFRVLEAANADEALALLEQEPDIRIMFTDVDMPGSLDGLKLAGAVRDRWPPVQIIVTSGHRQISPDELPAGSPFLPKPYDLATVTEVIRAMGSRPNAG